MSSTVSSKAAASLRPVDPKHPHVVPILDDADRFDEAPDQPFAEGAQDMIDPDLRHRMVSEAAYHCYVERGYADGFDQDDWLQAEAEVDHVLLNRQRSAENATAD
jgi:hypothetical protein